MAPNEPNPLSSLDRPPLIVAEELTKRFDGVTALDRIDFSVHSGEMFGFLGPNGAGKTTTILLLTGLARPDSGAISIGGLDLIRNPKAAQHLIGIVPDESNLYPELSGFDNLCFCASLYGMRKAERRRRAWELLETFGLLEDGERKFSTYSKGMKRKLTIAAGIIHDPQILFLDEPTTGIDVASARQIRQLVSGLHGSGKTLFLTTHYIEEAERLCERIAFIVKGRIVRIDTIENLLRPLQGRHAILISLSHAPDDFFGLFRDAFPAYEFESVTREQFRVESESPIPIGPLLRFVESHGAEVTEARKVRLSLEDVFVRITGLEPDAMKKDREKGGGGA